MTNNAYKLDPLDYKVDGATIKSLSFESYGASYLALELQHDSNTMQSYPAISLKDIEDTRQEIYNFLDVKSFDEAKDKKVYVINNFSHIFALYNENNNNFFCLQAKYFPEAYSESLKAILKKEPHLSVAHLNPSEALLYTFLYSLAVQDNISSKLHKIASSFILYQKLDQEIENKNEINTKKLKI